VSPNLAKERRPCLVPKRGQFKRCVIRFLMVDTILRLAISAYTLCHLRISSICLVLYNFILILRLGRIKWGAGSSNLPGVNPWFRISLNAGLTCTFGDHRLASNRAEKGLPVVSAVLLCFPTHFSLTVSSHPLYPSPLSFPFFYETISSYSLPRHLRFEASV
jgi:hypothetical protein